MWLKEHTLLLNTDKTKCVILQRHIDPISLSINNDK